MTLYILAILYPTPLANLVVEVGTWHSHQILLYDDDDAIKRKRVSRSWPFVRGIHRSPVNSPTKASDAEFDVFLDLHLDNGWANHQDAGDLRHHRAHYEVTVMNDICCFDWPKYSYTSL